MINNPLDPTKAYDPLDPYGINGGGTGLPDPTGGTTTQPGSPTTTPPEPPPPSPPPPQLPPDLHLPDPLADPNPQQKPGSYTPGKLTPAPPPPAPPAPDPSAGAPPPAPAAVGAPPPPPPSLFNIGADANNKYGNQTYMGFDPQNHQGANLNDPNNAKYALMQFLAQNGGLTGGKGGNAKTQADALNKLYGSAYGNANFFNASDDETIQMPDGQYVHYAPNGYGAKAGQFDPSALSEVFWGSSGGPGGGGNGGGGTGGAGLTGAGPGAAGAGGNNLTLEQLIASLGHDLTPMGGQTQDTNQANQDPFSQLIAGGYGSMIGSGGAGIAPLNIDLQDSLDQLITGRNPGAGGGIGALQGARSQFDASHSAMLNQAEADLANRGLLSQPGTPQGSETTSIDSIMRSLAPSFDAAMGNFLTNAYGQAGNMARDNNSTMLDSLKGAGGYQNQNADIALRTLAQNNDFNKFIANFGLDRDKTLYDIASGQNTDLMNLLSQFLNATATTSNGHV